MKTTFPGLALAASTMFGQSAQILCDITYTQRHLYGVKLQVPVNENGRLSSSRLPRDSGIYLCRSAIGWQTDFVRNGIGNDVPLLA